MSDNERIVGVCDWFWRYALRAVSLSVFRSWSVVCGCTCSSCHIIAVDIYICSIRHCGALLTRPDRRGATSVLPVGGWTSVVTGVFRWVQVAVHVRLDSIWVTFTNVVSCSPVLSSTNDFDDVWAMIGCTYYSGREPQCPVIVNYRNRLSCIEWGFPAATCMVMVSCTLPKVEVAGQPVTTPSTSEAVQLQQAPTAPAVQPPVAPATPKQAAAWSPTGVARSSYLSRSAAA